MASQVLSYTRNERSSSSETHPDAHLYASSDDEQGAKTHKYDGEGASELEPKIARDHIPHAEPGCAFEKLKPGLTSSSDAKLFQGSNAAFWFYAKEMVHEMRSNPASNKVCVSMSYTRSHGDEGPLSQTTMIVKIQRRTAAQADQQNARMKLELQRHSTLLYIIVAMLMLLIAIKNMAF